MTTDTQKEIQVKLNHLYKDCSMALSGEWDKSDDGFEVMQENILDIANMLNIEINDAHICDDSCRSNGCKENK